MVLVTAYLEYKEGKKDELIGIATDCIQNTRKETGCKSYNLYASTDKNLLMFLEEWENQEALDAHANTSHFKKFAGAIGDLLAKDLEIKTYIV